VGIHTLITLTVQPLIARALKTGVSPGVDKSVDNLDILLASPR